MTRDEFRALASSFPEAAAGSHQDTSDFRVGGRIFATLRDSDGRAVLKLSHDEQQLLRATAPGLFEPVDGAWGQKGWTRVVLDTADAASVSCRRRWGVPYGVGSPSVSSTTPTRIRSAFEARMVPAMLISASSGCGATTRRSSGSGMGCMAYLAG